MARATSLRVAQWSVEQFALQRGEERLGDGVVERIPDGSHRADEPGAAESLAKTQDVYCSDSTGGRNTGLAAVVRVGHCSVGGLAAEADHLDGVDDELGAQVVGDRPADNRRDQASMATAR